MKYCVNCGAELEDDALYCDECGVKQDAENAAGQREDKQAAMDEVI